MKLRVLVVEDDPQYRDLLRVWLESEGHEALLAGTLEQGFVGIEREHPPDVVLLSIQLGNQSGLTLVRWARKQRDLALLPIVAVVGLVSDKEMKSIHEAGCDTCFTKPIDFIALREYLAGLALPSVSWRGR